MNRVLNEPPSDPGWNPNQGFTDWPYSEPDPAPPQPVQQPLWRRWGGTLSVTLLVLIFAGALLAVTLHKAQQEPEPSPIQPAPVAPVTDLPAGTSASPDLAVSTRYVVEGSGRATITYRTLSGDDVETDMPLPWSTNLDVVVPMVGAQSLENGAGTITCRVEQYGKRVAEQTSKGTQPNCTATGPVG